MASLSFLLRIIFFIAAASLATGRRRHQISFRAPNLRPSSLVWDPTAQHFLVGSSSLPVVSSVSDAGVAETQINDTTNLPPGSRFPLISLDNPRRRLLAVVSGGDATFLAAYDLQSPLPRRKIFLSLLPFLPSAIAVDPSSGSSFLVVSEQNQILRVDLHGNTSVFGAAGSHGLAGIAITGKGYFLAISSEKKIYKVNGESGKGKEVLVAGARGGAAILAMRKDGSLAVVSGQRAEVLVSGDGWGEAAVYEDVAVGDGRWSCRGAAARERSLYVLMAEEEGGDEERIEEVEWRREEEGEWIVGMVLLGLGMVYFLYWRFQMGRLVGNMNKKRA